MPEHKYTSGPWEIQKAEDAYCIASVGNLVIMPTAGKVKHDNSEADANLIAAAPDLLEALETIVKSLSDQDDEGMIEHAEQMIAARAAIAKAIGQA